MIRKIWKALKQASNVHIGHMFSCVGEHGKKCPRCERVITLSAWQEKQRCFCGNTSLIEAVAKSPVPTQITSFPQRITVTVRNLSGDFRKTTDVPLDMKLGDFRLAAAKIAGWSSIPVCLVEEKTNKVLRDNSTFGELGIQNGTVFILSPEAEGGGTRLNISAPINIPDLEEMTVLLVQADVVYRLEEYRSDQQHWEAIMWTLVGAILGVLVNWITNEPIVISKISILAIIMFSILACIAFASVVKYRKRAEKMKERVLNSKTVNVN